MHFRECLDEKIRKTWQLPILHCKACSIDVPFSDARPLLVSPMEDEGQQTYCSQAK